MNNKKIRITAVFSLVCMIVSLFSMQIVFSEETAAVAEENTVEIKEVYNLHKAEILEGLGIIKDAEAFCQKDGITRAEMADIMVKMSGMAESSPNENVSVHFTDVNDESEYAGNISLAVEMGIINGNGDYTFSPDEYVEYPAMVKMAIIVLGYEVQAQLQGGYPIGYMSVASKLGLNTVAPAADGLVSGDRAAAFLYEMLDTDIAYISGVGESVSYTTIEGKNLLTENLKTYMVDGVVTANKNTSLYASTNLGDKEIEIDKLTYDYNGDASMILGYRVEAYYRQEKNSDVREIVYIGISDKNEAIIVNAEDATYNGDSYTYYDDNDKEKTAKLYEGAALIFNGKAISSPDFDMSKLQPDEGSITLIDNDGDRLYNVVIVNSYVNTVVDVASPYSMTITDKYLTERNINLKNGDDVYDYEIYDKNGKAVELSAIKEYDVLSVEKNEENGYYIRKSTDSVTGTINRTSAEKNTVYIDGVKYKISNSYVTSGQQKIAVGDSGTYLLDIYGKIAGKKQVKDSNIEIGFITKLGSEEGISVNPVMKVFTIYSEETKYEFAKTVEVDGVKIKRGETDASGESKIVSAIMRGTTGENPTLLASAKAGQLIRYERNSANEIVMVDTAYVNTSAGEDNTTLRRSVSYQDGDNAYYKKYGMGFADSGNTKVLEIADENAIVLVVSLPFTGVINTDFVMASGGYFADNNRYDISSFVYTKDKVSADVIVVYKDFTSTKVEEGATEMVVDEIGEVLGDDGMERMEIRGYHEGVYKNYAVSDTAMVDFDVQQGDFIRFNRNGKNEITVLEHVYSAKDDAFSYTSAYRPNDGSCKNEFVYAGGSGTPDVGLRMVYGYLYHRYNNQLIISKTKNVSEIADATKQERTKLVEKNIYVYDKADTKEPVRLGTEADLVQYTKNSSEPSRVIVRMYGTGIRSVLVIK